MNKEAKTKIANGWLSLMWIGFATATLILGTKYPIIFWFVIGGFIVIRMTIWAVKQVQS